MFSSMKAYIYAAVGTAFAVLLAILKIKSSKLKVAEQIVEHQKSEIKLKDTDKEVSSQIRKEQSDQALKIQEEYDELQIKAVESIDDKLLSDELVQLLHSRSKDRDSSPS